MKKALAVVGVAVLLAYAWITYRNTSANFDEVIDLRNRVFELESQMDRAYDAILILDRAAGDNVEAIKALHQLAEVQSDRISAK